MEIMMQINTEKEMNKTVKIIVTIVLVIVVMFVAGIIKMYLGEMGKADPIIDVLAAAALIGGCTAIWKKRK
jgi:TM2 domain-containing membrane protein YozV